MNVLEVWYSIKRMLQICGCSRFKSGFYHVCLVLVTKPLNNTCFLFNRDKWCADCLMIDGLVNQCGQRLIELWKRDEGGTGQYPPPSLHVSSSF